MSQYQFKYTGEAVQFCGSRLPKMMPGPLNLDQDLLERLGQNQGFRDRVADGRFIAFSAEQLRRLMAACGMNSECFDDVAAEALLDGNVGEVIERINGFDDPEILSVALGAAKRVTVKRAIEKRLDEVTAE